jgi:hypothetical protein
MVYCDSLLFNVIQDELLVDNRVGVKMCIANIFAFG